MVAVIYANASTVLAPAETNGLRSSKRVSLVGVTPQITIHNRPAANSRGFLAQGECARYSAERG